MPRRLPPLNALRAFEAAARHQSMVAAAAELGVTPAAVSEQVRGLETRLRTPLFQRGARGIVLTEEGRAFLPGLSDGFDRLAWASEAIHERRVRGRVGISLLPALAADWLVPRLPDLRRALPGVDLLIRTERRLIDFAREEVDLAIRFGPGPFRGLEARRLMYEDVFPVCAPALAHGPRAPKVLGDLAEPGVALLHDIDAHPQQTWMDWRGWFRRAGLPESAAARGLYFNEHAVILAAAIAGEGFALGRGPAVAEHLARGRLVRPFAGVWRAEWSYWMVAPAPALRRPAVMAVVDWLAAQCADDEA